MASIATINSDTDYLFTGFVLPNECCRNFEGWLGMDGISMITGAYFRIFRAGSDLLLNISLSGGQSCKVGQITSAKRECFIHLRFIHLRLTDRQ